MNRYLYKSSIIWFFILFFFNCILFPKPTYAQILTPTEDVRAFEENKTFYLEAYPHVLAKAKITKIEKLNEKHTMLYYTDGLNEYETVVNSARENLLLVASCRKINPDDLPDIVEDAVHRSLDVKPEIVKAFVVQTPYSYEFYRIDILLSNEEEGKVNSLFYNSLGQYVNPPY
ncbi:MAG: hypothetical protein DWQ44_00690 [Bacteroidetes bacterium]|nr:MAG: hypothetical protein DWQ33_04065 [Bacteroidota bacterium]REK07539.1 MAG: hypothetical protein DWQ39_01205 [Bacteroidota bacterium]REK37028.1 MAG: hypothetical protein DWQ44_00690 [Bacteroidota bacterium]REK47850.1 MAG: hypothetical protein DWQ48_11755 [Bacteroidota bacterium]